MKIIFIRHGEPNYEIDSLTEKGWREAEMLSKRTAKWNVTDLYCSPLGRAKDTASFHPDFPARILQNPLQIDRRASALLCESRSRRGILVSYRSPAYIARGKIQADIPRF